MDRRLVLFDIDGTLIRSGGVGRGAMNEAGARALRLPGLFEGHSFAGAVDPDIVGRALRARGVVPRPRLVARLKAAYLRELARQAPRRPGQVMPGVERAVRAVGERAQVALLTGNWRRGAETKLRAHGLAHLFDFGVGAFGEDGAVRTDLLPVAVRRFRRRTGFLPDRVWVIGDTPADVRCARVPVGAEVVAVAVQTGFATLDELAQAGPDLLIEDLDSGLDRLLATMG